MKTISESGLRMLALDMDNTLLRSDLTISFRTKNAVKRVGQAGVTVVLASGRTPLSMDRFSRLLGFHKKPGFLICDNGSLVRESHTGKIICETKIEPAAALAACDLASAEGFAVQMFENDTMYVSRQNEFSSYDQKLTGARQVVVENFRDMVGKGCYKLIIPGDPMLLKPLESLIRTYLGKDITLFTSRPYYLEIMPRETDKGTALAKIAEIAGVSAGETLAVGDSMNDEAMIRWAGIGVAMANGDERIKTIADFVTERTNDEDGVADVIDRYFFGKGSPDE